MAETFAEDDIDARKRSRYRGTVRVSLDALLFESNLTGDTQQLKTYYQQHKAFRLEPQNHIPVSIDGLVLRRCLEASGLCKKDLFKSRRSGYPLLQVSNNTKLSCLRSSALAAAAKIYYQEPQDRWWVIDLYDIGADQTLEHYLKDQHWQAGRLSDGEVIHKLSEYSRPELSADRQHLLSTLGVTAQKHFRTLSEKRENMELYHALQKINAIPGMRPALHLSTLNALLALHCNEELTCYIVHTIRIWQKIVCGRSNWLSKIDSATVKALEGKAPSCSLIERVALQSQIRAKKIFVNFSEDERKMISERLERLPAVIIPTQNTFFRDAQCLLKPWMTCVKRLLPPVPRTPQSLFSILADKLAMRNWTVVQLSEKKSERRSCCEEDSKRIAYLQLFIFAMRHWTEIPQKKSTQGSKAKATSQADKDILRAYGDLAYGLGYDTQEIHRVILLPESRITDVANGQPSLVSNDEGPTMRHRSGGVTADAHEHDKKYIFWDHLVERRSDLGDHITSFFVLKCQFHAFFKCRFPEGRIEAIGGNDCPPSDANGSSTVHPSDPSDYDSSIESLQDSISSDSDHDDDHSEDAMGLGAQDDGYEQNSDSDKGPSQVYQEQSQSSHNSTIGERHREETPPETGVYKAERVEPDNLGSDSEGESSETFFFCEEYGESTTENLRQETISRAPPAKDDGRDRVSDRQPDSRCAGRTLNNAVPNATKAVPASTIRNGDATKSSYGSVSNHGSPNSCRPTTQENQHPHHVPHGNSDHGLPGNGGEDLHSAQLTRAENNRPAFSLHPKYTQHANTNQPHSGENASHSTQAQARQPYVEGYLDGKTNYVRTREDESRFPRNGQPTNIYQHPTPGGKQSDIPDPQHWAGRAGSHESHRSQPSRRKRILPGEIPQSLSRGKGIQGHPGTISNGNRRERKDRIRSARMNQNFGQAAGFNQVPGEGAGMQYLFSPDVNLKTYRNPSEDSSGSSSTISHLPTYRNPPLDPTRDDSFRPLAEYLLHYLRGALNGREPTMSHSREDNGKAEQETPQEDKDHQDEFEKTKGKGDEKDQDEKGQDEKNQDKKDQEEKEKKDVILGDIMKEKSQKNTKMDEIKKEDTDIIESEEDIEMIDIKEEDDQKDIEMIDIKEEEGQEDVKINDFKEEEGQEDIRINDVKEEEGQEDVKINDFKEEEGQEDIRINDVKEEEGQEDIRINDVETEDDQKKENQEKTHLEAIDKEDIKKGKEEENETREENNIKIKDILEQENLEKKKREIKIEEGMKEEEEIKIEDIPGEEKNVEIEDGLEERNREKKEKDIKIENIPEEENKEEPKENEKTEDIKKEVDRERETTLEDIQEEEKYSSGSLLESAHGNTEKDEKNFTEPSNISDRYYRMEEVFGPSGDAAHGNESNKYGRKKLHQGSGENYIPNSWNEVTPILPKQEVESDDNRNGEHGNDEDESLRRTSSISIKKEVLLEPPLSGIPKAWPCFESPAEEEDTMKSTSSQPDHSDHSMSHLARESKSAGASSQMDICTNEAFEQLPHSSPHLDDSKRQSHADPSPSQREFESCIFDMDAPSPQTAMDERNAKPSGIGLHTADRPPEEENITNEILWEPRPHEFPYPDQFQHGSGDAVDHPEGQTDGGNNDDQMDHEDGHQGVNPLQDVTQTDIFRSRHPDIPAEPNVHPIESLNPPSTYPHMTEQAADYNAASNSNWSAQLQNMLRADARQLGNQDQVMESDTSEPEVHQSPDQWMNVDQGEQQSSGSSFSGKNSSTHEARPDATDGPGFASGGPRHKVLNGLVSILDTNSDSSENWTSFTVPDIDVERKATEYCREGQALFVMQRDVARTPRLFSVLPENCLHAMISNTWRWLIIRHRSSIDGVEHGYAEKVAEYIATHMTGQYIALKRRREDDDDKKHSRLDKRRAKRREAIFFKGSSLYSPVGDRSI